MALEKMSDMIIYPTAIYPKSLIFFPTLIDKVNQLSFRKPLKLLSMISNAKRNLFHRNGIGLLSKPSLHLFDCLFFTTKIKPEASQALS